MAALQNTLHVSEHSPDGKFYAFINSDGKLQIWDTETSEFRQEYVPKAHLSGPFVCFVWINVDNAVAAKKVKQEKNSSLYIAIGTKKGGVSLYSFAKAEIESSLKGGGHQGSVTAICRGPNDTLFTCGEDCRVVIWSLLSGTQISSWNVGKEKPSNLIYLTLSNRLIITDRQLKLWSIENEEVEETFTGHPTNITILKYISIKSKEFVLTASKTDRVLYLWCVTSPKQTNNAGSYLMEDIAFNVSYKLDSNGCLTLGAVTRSGVLHVYLEEDLLNAKVSKRPSRPKVTIEIASQSTSVVTPISILTAALDFGVNLKNIQIGYGDRQAIRFETIELDFSEKRQVLQRKDPKRMKSNKSTDEKEKSVNLAMKTITPIVKSEDVEYQTVTNVPRKGTKTTEIPMETRLENLSLDKDGGKRNVAQLLIQALHSHDVALLRTVFTNKDEQVIRSTLVRLPPQYVRDLVNELTQLAQKKTANVQIAVTWIKILVQTHASQLMAIGTLELFSMFGPLLGIVEYRANTLQQLTKLSGRLDLLVNQLKQNTDEEVLDDANLLVYEDQDTSDSDDLAVKKEESSDDQWEEDEEEEEEEEENAVGSSDDEKMEE